MDGMTAPRVIPMKKTFVARVENIDLREPVTKTDLSVIQDAMNRYAILIFPGQDIDDPQQVAFSQNFGTLEDYGVLQNPKIKMRLASQFVDVSNIDDDGNVLSADSYRRAANLGNRLWHTDSSFKKDIARYSFLSAREVPPSGGETEFTDMRAAYDALPARTKTAIENLEAEHSLLHSREVLGFTDWSPEQRAALPSATHPLVHTIPESGRKTLYLASHAFRVAGMPISEGRLLLYDLTEHATQRRFVYRHRWRLGDLVVWDNRCTMHRARAYDDVRHRRDMRRTTVSEHPRPS